MTAPTSDDEVLILRRAVEIVGQVPAGAFTARTVPTVTHTGDRLDQQPGSAAFPADVVVGFASARSFDRGDLFRRHDAMMPGRTRTSSCGSPKWADTRRIERKRRVAESERP